MDDFILSCIDGENFNEAVCDYGVFIANNTQKPLHLLNIIEHNQNNQELDLSGNISLGEKDDLLEKLTNQEAIFSKASIKKSRELLENLKQKAKKSIKSDVTTSLIHGEVVPNLIEIKEDIKVIILGITSNNNSKIGDNIQEIIREIHKPVLLVNQEFTQPKKILIAYNGSEQSRQILRIIAENPLFAEVQRTIVTVNNNEDKAIKLLYEASEIFAQKNIDVDTKWLQGDKKELISYCDENCFDILAMGAYSKSRLKEFVFGSFTSYILENSTKPIFLFR